MRSQMLQLAQHFPMMPHDKPQEPWENVGMDLFQLKGKDYLLLTDYLSNYPKFFKLSSMATEHIIAHTKAMFACHGIAATVMSDNGPQIAVITLSPLYS